MFLTKNYKSQFYQIVYFVDGKRITHSTRNIDSIGFSWFEGCSKSSIFIISKTIKCWSFDWRILNFCIEVVIIDFPCEYYKGLTFVVLFTLRKYYELIEQAAYNLRP